MERTKKYINIEKGYPVVKMPFDFIDRLRAEGVKQVSFNINDMEEYMTIRPVIEDKK